MRIQGKKNLMSQGPWEQIILQSQKYMYCTEYVALGSPLDIRPTQPGFTPFYLGGGAKYFGGERVARSLVIKKSPKLNRYTPF